MMKDTIESVQNEIEKLNVKLAELEKERDYLESLPPVEQLAIEIHNMTCHHNHADGCGWYYEIHNGIHDWSGHAHSRALQTAKRAITMSKKENISVETLVKAYKIVAGS